MKYMIANDQATLTSFGSADEITMFPQNAVLAIESITDTTTELLIQSSTDTDDADSLVFKHDDKSAAATHKVERNLIDDMVAAINSDSRLGFTVLFDACNNVKLPNQILANDFSLSGKLKSMKDV